MLAPSAAPPNAVKMWMDDRAIYVELPLSPGYESTLPCILRFAISEGGLSKALNILRERKTDFAGPIQAAPRKLLGSAEAHATAAQALKARGII